MIIEKQNKINWSSIKKFPKSIGRYSDYNPREEKALEIIEEIINHNGDYFALVLNKPYGARNEIYQLVSEDEEKLYKMIDENFEDYEILISLSISDVIRVWEV